SISTDSAGGYLAPDNLSSEFLYGLTNYSSIIQAGANIVDLDGPGKSWAFARQTTIPTLGWYGENETIAESDPTFDTTVFTPKKAAFISKLSNELLQDAINGQSRLTEICLRTAAQGIDAIALNGTGSNNQPLGILNYGGINEVDFSSTAPTNYDKLIEGRYEIVKDKADDPTSIIMHPRTYKDYMLLKGTDNQPLMTPKLLEKLSWYESQALSITEAPGANSSAIMGDFKNLWIGMRLRPTVFVDPFSGSSEDQVLFRMTFRIDILATRAEHFCLLKNIATS
ncbi:MAG: HK97 family phage major capsid protein, partial [Cyclobacteriaceae bacterium]